ncbi:MAG: NAD(P)H-dependent flavin oxidoreductase [Alphaproteobacteria bacterium]
MAGDIAAAWDRGARFLGSRHAIMGGAMTWVSERHLVAALSNCGGFGVLACGAMTPEQLDAEIAGAFALTSAPFGVNLIVMHPELARLVEVCLDRGVGHIVLAGGVPAAAIVKRARSRDAKVIGFAPALAIARKLVRAGIDALIIEGMEAGGHIGPVSTGVLAQEILPNIRDVPVFVAGGIGRGEAVASFVAMGAAGCQLGTRLVCAHESIAHPNMKRAFIRAAARDAQPSVQLDPSFPVIPVRALVNGGTRRFMDTQRDVIARYRAGELDQKEAQLAIEHFWAGALRRAVIDGDVETGSVMAGQSVGMVTAEQSMAEILAELIDQAEGLAGIRL